MKPEITDEEFARLAQSGWRPTAQPARPTTPATPTPATTEPTATVSNPYELEVQIYLEKTAGWIEVRLIWLKKSDGDILGTFRFAHDPSDLNISLYGKPNVSITKKNCAKHYLAALGSLRARLSTVGALSTASPLSSLADAAITQRIEEEEAKERAASSK